ncbi:MAG: TonB family protein [Acidobacteria bacterium]|nr:TonB family protein [Acidobacteriota bacterium]
MFEDSLIESGNKLQTKRGATTLLSFILQMMLVAILVLVPLIYTEALPMKALMSTVIIAPPPPPPPPPPPAPAQVVHVVKIETELVNGALRTPTKIPEKVKMIKEDATPPPSSAVAGVVGGVPGGMPGGQIGGVIGGIVSSVPVAVPKVAAPPPKLKISQGVAQGHLLHQVQPQYPAIARAARISGSVVIKATIGKDGTMQGLVVQSGPPMLINAALDAVKQWRYQPWVLSGEPVEVETVITVNFNLSGG